jgi:GNAT superfamily N-acetyltransferase
MTWVATDDDSLLGLTGLLWEAGESTIEPVVVDHRYRRQGIGRRLIDAAIEESRRRRATDINISRSLATYPPFKRSTGLGSGHSAMCSCSSASIEMTPTGNQGRNSMDASSTADNERHGIS